MTKVLWLAGATGDWKPLLPLGMLRWLCRLSGLSLLPRGAHRAQSSRDDSGIYGCGSDDGISGDRTEHVLWRITHGELDGIHPKVAVIMIGTNNVGHFKDETPEWAAAGVKKIVETVHEKLPDTKVLLLGVFPRGASSKDALRQKVVAINSIIAKLDDGQKTRYLDISKTFLDAAGDLPKEIMPDALHPNARGYDMWYDAMWPMLEKLLKQ